MGGRRAVRIVGAMLAFAFLGAPVAPTRAAEIQVPNGDSPVFGTNPAQQAQTTEPDVFGPLAPEWVRTFRGPVNYPVLAGDKLFVAAHTNNGGSDPPDGTILSRLDPQSGETVWSREFSTTNPAAYIAVDSGVVVATDSEAVAYAFDANTGTPIWTRQIAGERGTTPPLVDGGVVYFDTGTSSAFRGIISAHSIETGEPIWSKTVPFYYGGGMAMDTERIYVGNDCGSVGAYDRDTGEAVWGHGHGSQCFRAPVVLKGGVLYSEGGLAHDAGTGAELQEVHALPVVVSGNRAFGGSNAQFDAFSLDGGDALWSTPHVDINQGVPILGVNSSVYSARAYYFDNHIADLRVYEQSSGDLLYKLPMPYPDYIQTFGFQAGMVAGQGRLFVNHGLTVTSMAPMLRPEPNGIAAASLRPDVVAGKKSSVVAGVGEAKREPERKIRLRADAFPYGTSDPAGSLKTRDEGTVEFEPRPRKNTRYVTEAPNGSRDEVKVFAYPRTRIALTEKSFPKYKLETKLDRIPASVLAGRQLVAYFADRGIPQLRRVGIARIRVTDGVGKAQMTISVPTRVEYQDILAVCEGVAQEGLRTTVRITGRVRNVAVRPRATPAPRSAP